MLVGLVGKPNVGKSTFFRAATLAQVATGNYPFVTIKPNHGTAYVKTDCASTFFNVTPTPREGYVIDGKRFVPIELMDVAGLVPGAHSGQGMGNAFLDDLRQADVLIHIIDISGSTNEKGEPVPVGSYDPANDIRFLETELDMWYLGIIQKGWDKFARTVQQTKGDIAKAIAKQLSGLKVTEEDVEQAISTFSKQDPTAWEQSDLQILAKKLREKTKPIIIGANRIDIAIAKENLEKIQKEFPHYTIFGCSAESEVALREASRQQLIEYTPGESTFTIKTQVTEKQKHALNFIEKLLSDWKTTGVQQILDKAVFDVLDYMPIFPGGAKKLEDSQGRVLPDCFLLKRGSTALDFAYKIHTDLGKRFIRAIDVKKKLTIGKDHILQDGDVIEIISDA
ncbi:MAG: redox-regulated ATPase YchF [Candidatus Woesearchaeota archaeon]